jgi:hypothetical protein
MTREQVVKTIRQNIEATGSLREQARLWGISAAYLSDIMNGRRNPGKKILSKLGLEPIVKVTRTFAAKSKRQAA